VLTQVWAGSQGVVNDKVRRELEAGGEAVQIATVAIR
jgi:hypothetical protein